MDEHTNERNWATSDELGVSHWRRMTLALLEDYKMKRGMIFGSILVAALAAFEIFNFSTTDFALRDFLGDERFIGVRWATILAVAFCGIDFAGLARLFTPEQGRGEPVEVWYLIGAWFLGATLNAMATWWAVTLTLLQHSIGNEVLSREDLLTFVPVFVAALVWLTRILIIGTFSVAGERLFTQAERIIRETQRAAAMPQPAVGPARRAGVPARIIGESDDRPPARAPIPPVSIRRDEPRPTPAGLAAKPPRPPVPLARPAPKPSQREVGRVTGDERRGASSPGRAERDEIPADESIPPFVRPPRVSHVSRAGNGSNGANGTRGIE